MKATGIVRRVDDLGRVVIPKEIRRTLRIRESDPLEIFVDHDGEVILKKYSPIGELADFAKEYVDSLHDVSGHIAVVTDREAVIAVAGASKKELLDRRLGPLTKSLLSSRQNLVQNEAVGEEALLAGAGVSQRDHVTAAMAPIVVGAEAVGIVILYSREAENRMGPLEEKLVTTAASVLAAQMA